MKVADLVQEKIAPLFNDLDVKLVEVEYVKRIDGMHLVVYIDNAEGVNINDCEKVSKLIDGVIEDLNPTKDEAYYLDVSSYGIDKPLKYDWQFEKYLDKKVTVTLYKKVDDLKEFDAVLKEYKENYVFELKNGKQVELSKDVVARVMPYIEF